MPSWTTFILCLLSTALAAKLPNYITTCSIKDPNLAECTLKSGRRAIPKFINGDARTRVPNLNPMLVSEMRVAQGSRQIGLNIILKNIKIYGLKDVDFAAARPDFKRQYSEWDFKIPRLEFIGNYTVSGRVLLLPIFGDGDANVTLTDVAFTFKHGWDFVKRNGKDHFKINKSDIDFNAGRAYFELQNLFNGDRLLGSNMNYFLNENWREVLKDVGPAVAQAFGSLISTILNNIGEMYPFDQVYPDKIDV